MSKLTRRIVSVFIATLFLLPQIASAATVPVTIDETLPIDDAVLLLEIPLAPTQTEYTMSMFATGNPAKIISVSSTPTKVGSKVHPDLMVTVAGTALVVTSVYLQRLVNGVWQSDSIIYHSQYVTGAYSTANTHDAVTNGTYRFLVEISTSSTSGSDSYTFTGNSFVFK